MSLLQQKLLLLASSQDVDGMSPYNTEQISQSMTLLP
jgi:hypothetical protein